MAARSIILLLLGLLVAALAQEAPVAPSVPSGICPGFEAILVRMRPDRPTPPGVVDVYVDVYA